MEATAENGHAARTSGYVGSIIVNGILLYLAHHLLDWQVGWIQPGWSSVLWAVDMSLGASIAANVLFIAYDAKWFRSLAGSVSCAFAAFATWWVYTVFPFEFGSVEADGVARLVLVVILVATVTGMLATAIVALVELARIELPRATSTR